MKSRSIPIELRNRVPSPSGESRLIQASIRIR